MPSVYLPISKTKIPPMKENSQKEFSQITLQFIKFCLVSLPGAGIAFGVLNIFMFLWGNFPAANVVTFVIVVTWNFILHRRFTFGCSAAPITCQWVKYVLVCLQVTALNWIISISLYYSFPYFSKHFNITALIGTGSACIASFIYSRSHVFRK
jgi:putative flippase GtrA